MDSATQELSAETQALCHAAAARHGVSGVVHQADLIFDFLYNNAVFPTKADAINYYFDDGARSANKVLGHIQRFTTAHERSQDVLEFASGYGAVTRHAKRALSPHRLASSDIHPAALNFLARELGVEAVPSAHAPADFQPPRAYDVIFVLSFFSHMPRATWHPWLERLTLALTPGGILLFTTHGELSQKYFPQSRLDADGFWFEPQSEQRDLSGAEYGSTITSKSFVDQEIARLRVSSVFYEQGGWWDHQDLYIVRRPAGPA
jgi:SAM-dependent methyltransferase